MSALQLTTFYKGILNALSCTIDDSNGFVTYSPPGAQPAPCMVNDKRLILPINDALRAYNAAQQQAFHPLCESTVRGQSPVFSKLHALVAARLHSVLCITLRGLMDIAYDKTTHQRLTPKQMPLIQMLSDVDQKTSDALNAVIRVTDPLGTNRIISVFMHSQPKLDKPYRRACMISFPILNELAKPEHDIYGQRMRKKDKDAIAALLLYVLSDCDKPHYYSVGTNADIAPFFDCLMRGFIKVQRDLNNIIKQYRDFIPMADLFTSDLDWEGELSNTSFLSKQIPVLTGNEGDADVNVANNQTNVSATPGAAAVVNPSPMQPTQMGNVGQQNIFANTSANPPNVAMGVTGTAAAKVNASHPSASADEVAAWSSVVAQNTMQNAMVPQFAARGAAGNTPVFSNGMVNPNMPMMPGGMPMGMPMQQPWMGGMAPQPNVQPHGMMNMSHFVAQAQQQQMQQVANAWNPGMAWNGANTMGWNNQMPAWNQPNMNAWNGMNVQQGNMPGWMNTGTQWGPRV